ncbi:MAG: PEP-CTERM sorting domain-containing protein [Pirellulales bacterium]|nr:PEP-CTERM sorting domain-containing protein [Pirellulales bacterium]
MGNPTFQTRSEPSTLLLVGTIGLVGLHYCRRRHNR